MSCEGVPGGRRGYEGEGSVKEGEEVGGGRYKLVLTMVTI